MRSLTIAALVGLAGCASSVEVLHRPQEGSRPRTLALARPVVAPDEPVEQDRVLAAVARAVTEAGLVQVPAARFQAALQVVSKKPSRPAPTEYLLAAERAGADSLMVLEQLRYPGGSYLLFTHRALVGRVRLLKVPAGELLWEAEASECELDGPGQDLELVFATVLQAFGKYDNEAIARVYHDFAARLVRKLGNEFPTLGQVGDREAPSLKSVQLPREAAEASFGANEDLVIEAKGSPGCVAEALIPGIQGRYPLAEVAPGIYRGAVRILPGTGIAEGVVRVRLRDTLDRYAAASSREVVLVDAPQGNIENPPSARPEPAAGFQKQP
jgi:hypothetical protein